MNPFVPKITDYPKIYSTFISDKERKILKRKKLYNWEKPQYVAEQSADIIIKPDLGSTGTIGTISDIINGYYRGYEAIKQMIEDLECERGYSYRRKK